MSMPISADRIFGAVVLIVVSALALIGNASLWLIVLYTRSLRREASSWLLLSLSAADLLVAAVNMPTVVAALILGYWPLSRSACVVFGFTAMLTFVGSVMALVAVSLDRYALICQTQRYTKYRQRCAYISIAVSWTVSLLLSTPPLLGWSRYDFLPGQSFCFCDWTTSISYTFFMVGCCFCVPCTVMLFCYLNVLAVVRRSSKRVSSFKADVTRQPSEADVTRQPSEADVRRQASEADDNSQFDGNTRTESHAYLANVLAMAHGKQRPEQLITTTSYATKLLLERARRRRHDDMRLTIACAVVISVFVVCWLPFCVTMFMSVFAPGSVPRLIDLITLLLGCSNSCCNPIIYGLLNRRFRDAFRKLYCRRESS